jgi:hypothetical protein
VVWCGSEDIEGDIVRAKSQVAQREAALAAVHEDMQAVGARLQEARHERQKLLEVGGTMMVG